MVENQSTEAQQTIQIRLILFLLVVVAALLHPFYPEKSFSAEYWQIHHVPSWAPSLRMAQVFNYSVIAALIFGAYFLCRRLSRSSLVSATLAGLWILALSVDANNSGRYSIESPNYNACFLLGMCLLAVVIYRFKQNGKSIKDFGLVLLFAAAPAAVSLYQGWNPGYFAFFTALITAYLIGSCDLGKKIDERTVLISKGPTPGVEFIILCLGIVLFGRIYAAPLRDVELPPELIKVIAKNSSNFPLGTRSTLTDYARFFTGEQVEIFPIECSSRALDETINSVLCQKDAQLVDYLVEDRGWTLTQEEGIDWVSAKKP